MSVEGDAALLIKSRRNEAAHSITVSHADDLLPARLQVTQGCGGRKIRIS